MTRLLIPFLIPLLLIVLALIPARAVKVADITRIGGERTNILTGLGLVYGLKGTGDGGSFTPAIAPLRSMLAKFGDPVTMQQLGNAANVAVVMVTATVPAAGARDGDHLDVHVSSVGAAASLHGGRLFVTPMQGPLPGGPLLALADGPVTIEDPSTPTVGVIRAAAGGAVMETDLPAQSLTPAADSRSSLTSIPQAGEPPAESPRSSTIPSPSTAKPSPRPLMPRTSSSPFPSTSAIIRTASSPESSNCRSRCFPPRLGSRSIKRPARSS